MRFADLFKIFGTHARNARAARNHVKKGQNAGGDDASESKTKLDLALAERVASQLALGKETTFSYIDVDLTRTFPRYCGLPVLIVGVALTSVILFVVLAAWPSSKKIVR